MPKNIKILTSRKGYEFAPDGLRLSMISTKPIIAHIQQLFQFQVATIGSPIATFGEVPQTFPPGVIFDHGVGISQEKEVVPIRFLHFEPQRIVIDTAGRSSDVDELFKQLMHAFDETRVPDGSPVIAKTERVLDYSEISAQFSFALETLVAPPLWKLLRKTMSTSVSEKDSLLVPSLSFSLFSSKQRTGNPPGTHDAHSFTLTVRAGTYPKERIYFSSAPIDSSAHLACLEELENSLGSLAAAR